jgi:predicted RNA-binding protein associated with RNAse of E/G family
MTTHIHPPKVELFNLDERTNVDPKGFVRQVETYRHESFGVYMARQVPGHPNFTYMESWLLPGLGLRITDLWFTERVTDPQDFYIDIVHIDQTGSLQWRTLDLYLDILVHTGTMVQVVDTDELLAARDAGHLDATQTIDAFETTYAAVAGIASHGYDVNSWLRTKGIELTWQRK